MTGEAILVSPVRVEVSDLDALIIMRPPPGLVRHFAHLADRPIIRIGAWFTLDRHGAPLAMARAYRVVRCRCCRDGWGVEWHPASTTPVS